MKVSMYALFGKADHIVINGLMAHAELSVTINDIFICTFDLVLVHMYITEAVFSIFSTYLSTQQQLH